MKLAYCKLCGDVFSLKTEWKSCMCGDTAGRYFKDGLNAEIVGDNAVALGFENKSFRQALDQEPDTRPSVEFTAFVIEKNCPSILRH
jgi:hypothetical protein